MSDSSSLRRRVVMMVSLGLMVSGASLLVSLVSLTMRGAGEELMLVTMEELTRRLEDLETEHDLVLDTREEEVRAERLVTRAVTTPPMCLTLPDPGPCTQNILRW